MTHSGLEKAVPLLLVFVSEYPHHHQQQQQQHKPEYKATPIFSKRKSKKIISDKIEYVRGKVSK
jgi:hypothetical protein